MLFFEEKPPLAEDTIIEGLLIDKARGLIRENIKPEFYIDYGPDSLVCQVSAEAWKCYGRGGINNISQKDWYKLIRLYHKLTNQAVKICENGQFQFNNRHLSINPATPDFRKLVPKAP